jgi:hypothetical protein
MTIKIKFLAILLLLFTTTAVIIFAVHFRSARTGTRNVIKLSTFQTSIGWGYKIDINNKTKIYQPFVPVIETHSGFETKLIAENAGRIVLQRLIRNQEPILTLKDLQLAGVNIDKMIIKEVSSLD